ncbi:MAG: C40 family peptidase [Flavobacterium sp.]|nr:C40 family peptidase [Candidatus Neoflavobacterium equi]
MKGIIFTIAAAALLVSCKSNSSIVTKKEEAVKRGMYNTPEYTKVASSTNKNNASKAVNIKTAHAKSNVSKNTANSTLANTDADKVNVKVSKNETAAFYKSDDIISNAKTYLGVKYRSGGTSRQGMDCSGLVSTVFNEFDFELPRSSRDMASIGVKIEDDQVMRGDLVFFKTNGRSVINHVGIVVEVTEDEIKFIHSSTSRGVIISSNKEPYYNKSYAQANRIF